MARLRIQLFAQLVLLSLCASAHAQDSLKTIDNPGGGEIVYGPVTGQTSMQGAMGAVLRDIHSRFGERPQIGRFFQAGGTDSVATFFTVTAKSQGGKHIAGMVIVSMPSGTPPAGAIVYDDAQRFGTTANPMLKKLNEVWHPESAKSAPSSSGTPAQAAAVPPLQQTPFPDGSGSIGLPAGWQITSAGKGTVNAVGPNSESIHFGLYFPILDPRSPQTQMSLRSGRPLPGMYTAYPSGGDLVQAFLAVIQQVHQKQHAAMPTINITSSKKMPTSQTETDSVLLTADIDSHDGKGIMASSLLVSALRPITGGTWAITVNQGSLPKRLADQEWPTISAIASSWRLNGAVIQAQTQAEIGRIKQIGANAKAQADAAHAAEDAHNASVEARWDSQARSNQNFSNYLLDQTVVQDNNTGGHATVWNQYADSLVKNDPNRYQYVQTPDFLKGIDY
ncbi:MAG: hypothetical protein ABSA29_14840 [Terriglobales bacterium]|jgi:hypothetical protein